MKEHFRVWIFFFLFNQHVFRFVSACLDFVWTARSKVAAHVKDPTPTFRYEVRPDDSTKITDEGNRVTDQNSTPNRRRIISVGG